MDVYDAKKHEMTTWTPTNADGHFSGDSIPLKGAFARSINSVAVRLGQEMGIKNIAKTAHDMGITSPLDEQKRMIRSLSNRLPVMKWSLSPKKTSPMIRQKSLLKFG